MGNGRCLAYQVLINNQVNLALTLPSRFGQERSAAHTFYNGPPDKGGIIQRTGFS